VVSCGLGPLRVSSGLLWSWSPQGLKWSLVVSCGLGPLRVSSGLLWSRSPQGLKSSLTDYRAATLMVVCQLAVAVPLEAGLVDVLAAHVARSLLGDPVLAQEGLGCLVVLLQNQKEGSAGPR